MAAAAAGESRQAMIVAVEQYDDLAELANVDNDASIGGGANGFGDCDIEEAGLDTIEFFLAPSVVGEVSGGKDLEEFADEFTTWVPAPPERCRQLAVKDVKQLLRQMDTDPNTAKVIGYKEFPYTARGKLLGANRQVEREYWLQLSNVEKRLGNCDNLAILHVHYADLWGASPRTREHITQMNIRHTVKDSKAVPGKNAYWKKCPEENKWPEMGGRRVPLMGPLLATGWEWRDKISVSPTMHQLLMDAEICARKFRSITVKTPDASAALEGQRQALILSVQQDQTPGLHGLAVESDANLLKSSLQQLGWGVERGRGLGLADTKLAIQRFAESVSGSGAACLLAFIGHGVEMGGNIFLVPKDAEMFARRGESEATVFLLDCCRSGLPSSFQGRSGAPGSREELLKQLTDVTMWLTDVTMNTREQLVKSSTISQLTQDEERPTLRLVVNLQSCQDVRPDRIPSKTTWRAISQKDSRAFQVREEALGALQRWVEDEGGEQPGRMLVHGLGGTGKTTLGKIFAARAAAEGVCEAVLFLTLSDGSCMEEYVEVAKKLGASAESVEGMSEEKLRARVHGLLSSEKWEGKWLVVLDDLPDTEDKGVSWVGKEFPFGSGKTLVTSRCAEWAEEGGAENWGQVPLLGMTEAEACEWVRRRWVAWAGDEAGVLKLVRKLGCLPLAIDQAAAFAKEYNIATPELYLAAQAKSSKTLWAQWEIIRKRGYPFFFFEVVSHTFMTLAEAGDKNSVGAINLLKKMAFLHSEGIQQDLFQEDEWIHVSTLKRHSLVVDSHAPGHLGGMSINVLVQDVVREQLMGRSKIVALGGVMQALKTAIEGLDRECTATHEVGRRYARHVKAAASHVPREGDSQDSDGDLRLALVWCDEARQWLEKGAAILADGVGQNEQ